MRALAASCLIAMLALAGCATPFDNQPLNRPVTPGFIQSSQVPRDIVGANTIGLSLSGGGMRAAAFAHGVMLALAQADEAGTDVFDELTFMSSVSGGSLTAAYTALHGRAGLARFRAEVLNRDLERDLRLSLLSPVNLARLLAGGVNDRSNLAATLDADIFKGATFADLYRANKPDVWINATDLYNRTPFPFIPAAVHGPVQRPVAAARVRSRGRQHGGAAGLCARGAAHLPAGLPDAAAAADGADAGRPWQRGHGCAGGGGARHPQHRDADRMRYVKLADGGLTDNQGLTSILIARAISGTPYGPLNEADAVRLRRLLFLIVDAGRPPTGDGRWRSKALRAWTWASRRPTLPSTRPRA